MRQDVFGTHLPVASDNGRPTRTVHPEIYHEPLTVSFRSGGPSIFFPGRPDEQRAQGVGISDRESQSGGKDTRLVPAVSMIGVETVLRQLPRIHDGAIPVRKLHARS